MQCYTSGYHKFYPPYRFVYFTVKNSTTSGRFMEYWVYVKFLLSNYFTRSRDLLEYRAIRHAHVHGIPLSYDPLSLYLSHSVPAVCVHGAGGL